MIFSYISSYFFRKSREYSASMDAAEALYIQNQTPSDTEVCRRSLRALQEHKRAVLESSMAALKEAQILLETLRELLRYGGTQDSRPTHIKNNIELGNFCDEIFIIKEKERVV